MTLNLTRTDREQLAEACLEKRGVTWAQATPTATPVLSDDCALAAAVRDVVERHIEAQDDRDRRLASRVARQVLATLDERGAA